MAAIQGPRIIVLVIGFALAVLPTFSVLAQTTLTLLAATHVKPSEVAVPSAAKPGEVRRMIQPFADWTLICDENLRRRPTP